MGDLVFETSASPRLIEELGEILGVEEDPTGLQWVDIPVDSRRTDADYIRVYEE